MKKNIFKISVITIMLVLIYTTVASALSFTATMTPSSTTVAESTEFTISVKVSNLDVGQNGINSLSGYLKYDSSVFDAISDSSIEGLNSWSPTFNADSGKITLTKTTFVKSEEAVFQVTFKTKSGVSGKTGTISYTNIVASNSETEIAASDISTTITIGTAANNSANAVANNAPTINVVTNTNKTTNTNTNTNKVVNTQNATNNAISSYVNNSSSNEDIPYTGVEDTLVYVMLVVLALAIIFYVKFEMINKEIK